MRTYRTALKVCLALPFLLAAAACSSSSSEGSGGGISADTQGPLNGTYARMDDSGTAPFDSITFLDATHYEYMASNCAAMPATDDGTEIGDDDDDTSTADPDACFHTGTYTVTQTDLVLTDNGSTTSIDVPIAEAVADGLGADGGAGAGSDAGSGSGDGNASGESDGGSAGDDDGGGLLGRELGQEVGVQLITTPNGTFLLFNQSDLSAFNAAGSSMKRVTTTTTGSTTTSTVGIVSSAAVNSALSWVTAQMPYCQTTANHYDSACHDTCTRTGAANNTAWNSYRSDCSGLVSFAWGLKAPGLTTSTLHTQSVYIPTQDLQPGDSLTRPGHHTILFDKWINKAAGTAVIIQEPDCHKVAQTMNTTLHVGKSTSLSWGGATYYAGRNKGSSLL